MIFRIDRTIIQSNFSIFTTSRFHTWQTGGLTTTKPAGDSFLDREINTLFLVANKRGNTKFGKTDDRPTNEEIHLCAANCCCDMQRLNAGRRRNNGESHVKTKPVFIERTLRSREFRGYTRPNDRRKKNNKLPPTFFQPRCLRNALIYFLFVFFFSKKRTKIDRWRHATDTFIG